MGRVRSLRALGERLRVPRIEHHGVVVSLDEVSLNPWSSWTESGVTVQLRFGSSMLSGLLRKTRCIVDAY